MTDLKTKLNESSKDYADSIVHSGHDLHRSTVLSFNAGSEWTLKYLSEQGGEYKEFWICPEDFDTETGTWLGCDVRTSKPDDKLLPFSHVVDYEALLASEAKYHTLEQYYSHDVELVKSVVIAENESLKNKLALADARLEKCKKQRKHFIIKFWQHQDDMTLYEENKAIDGDISMLDYDLNSLTLDSLDKDKK